MRNWNSVKLFGAFVTLLLFSLSLSSSSLSFVLSLSSFLPGRFLLKIDVFSRLILILISLSDGAFFLHSSFAFSLYFYLFSFFIYFGPWFFYFFFSTKIYINRDRFLLKLANSLTNFLYMSFFSANSFFFFLV